MATKRDVDLAPQLLAALTEIAAVTAAELDVSAGGDVVRTPGESSAYALGRAKGLAEVALLNASTSAPSCLSKAADDEPVFILRALDRCAAAAVRDWAHRASGMGAPDAKVRGAMDVALEMDAYARTHGGGKTPD